MHWRGRNSSCVEQRHVASRLEHFRQHRRRSERRDRRHAAGDDLSRRHAARRHRRGGGAEENLRRPCGPSEPADHAHRRGERRASGLRATSLGTSKIPFTPAHNIPPQPVFVACEPVSPNARLQNTEIGQSRVETGAGQDRGHGPGAPPRLVRDLRRRAKSPAHARSMRVQRGMSRLARLPG